MAGSRSRRRRHVDAFKKHSVPFGHAPVGPGALEVAWPDDQMSTPSYGMSLSVCISGIDVQEISRMLGMLCSSMEALG